MKLLVLPVVLLLAPCLPSIAQTSKIDENFHGIDFRNRSYPYRRSLGKQKRITLRLEKGRYEYDFPDERGWFDISNVYLTDLTGDKRPEAIVMLWHVACGVSCDGGSALFYIYSFDNQRLKLLWQYETGALADGCGLKSFNAKRGVVTLELFGRCSQDNRTKSSTGKLKIKDLTRLKFRSNGSTFIIRSRQFLSAPERTVLNYEPQISVSQ